jgi:hypothetical protein
MILLRVGRICPFTKFRAVNEWFALLGSGGLYQILQPETGSVEGLLSLGYPVVNPLRP